MRAASGIVSRVDRSHGRAPPSASPRGRERVKERHTPLARRGRLYANGRGAYTLERTKKAATIFVRRFMEVTHVASVVRSIPSRCRSQAARSAASIRARVCVPGARAHVSRASIPNLVTLSPREPCLTPSRRGFSVYSRGAVSRAASNRALCCNECFSLELSTESEHKCRAALGGFLERM